MFTGLPTAYFAAKTRCNRVNFGYFPNDCPGNGHSGGRGAIFCSARAIILGANLITAKKTEDRAAEFRFFTLLPPLYRMQNTHPELLVGLDDKMSAVLQHWAVVNAALPPAQPLVLLADVERAGFAELRGAIRDLRGEVRSREMDVKLARGAYEKQKRVLRTWMRRFYLYMRAYFQRMPWCVLRGEVPGLGQSFDHWWKGAHQARAAWKMLENKVPMPCLGMPIDFQPDCSLANFTAVIRAFDDAHEALVDAELDLKIARGALDLVQGRVTSCLMAYGHGVRARLLDNEFVLDSVPRLWPRRKRARKGISAALPLAA